MMLSQAMRHLVPSTKAISAVRHQAHRCLSSSKPMGPPPMPRVLPSTSVSSSTAAATCAAKSKPNQKIVETMAGTGRANAVRGESYAENKSPVSWTSLFLVAVAAASAVAYYRIERERRMERALGKVVSSESDGWSPSPGYAKRVFLPTKYGWMPKDDGWGGSGKPAIGGPWTLVDLDGNLVSDQSFVGKWLLLYFGFARCPDICPSEMNKVAQVLDTLKKEQPHLYKKIVPIFVSVDPARDSLKALKEYAKDFHPDYIMLTGAPQQVQDMAKKYRVYVSKAEETEDDYLVDHSIVIYFHDDTGDLLDCFTQSMRASDLVEKIIEKMNFKPKPI